MSIRKLKSTRTNREPRWEAIVYVGRDPSGIRRSPTISMTFARKTEAEKWLRQQEGQKDNGVRLATTKETLAEYVTRWLPIHGTQVRAVTLYNYRATLNRWVLAPANGTPPLGTRRLTKLSAGDFEGLYVFMREQGIGPRGCQYLHGIVRRALKDAVKKNLLPRNPTDFVTVPKEDHGAEDEEAVVRAMEKAQVDGFLKAAKEDRLSAFWHVLLLGALRPCEAMALKWRDCVDFAAGTVRVTRTLTRLGLDRKTYPLGWGLTRPKTKRSRRTVPLPDFVMKELRRWQKLQEWERRTFQGEYNDHGFVFTTETGTPLDLSNLHRGSFRRVMEKAELGEWGEEPKKPRSGPTAKRPFTPAFRIYDLRHTGASLLLLAGVPLKVVSERLGHSTIVLTADTYGHLTGDMAQSAADKLELMFGTS